MCLYEYDPLIKSHTPSKFDGYKHGGSADMFLVCHVILQDHVNKE